MNHFIEIGESTTTKNIWITIHSGSRNLGKRICEYWQDIAWKKDRPDFNKEVLKIKDKFPKQEWNSRIQKLRNEINSYQKTELDYLEGENKRLYLEDMKFASWYAAANRSYMMHEVIYSIGNKDLNNSLFKSSCVPNFIESVHNYIDLKDNIIRKGAIRSYIGEKMIIPLNMRDGILICEGKSNPEWNFSAPHGAGRIYSRSKAKELLNMEEFKDEMKNIFSTSVDLNTIDESPMAYKDSNLIIKCIEPTATIIDRILPIHNMKDNSEERPWKKKKEKIKDE
jgi:RNA-splicing ligase RtcB